MDTYATHLPELVRVALTAREHILELGCGDYSTPVLANVAHHIGVDFTAMTSSREWGAKFEDIAHVDYVDWETVEFPQADVVFLDNEQTTRDRIKHLPALSKTARVVVLHDFANCERHEHWPALSACFKNLSRYERYENTTGVLWN